MMFESKALYQNLNAWGITDSAQSLITEDGLFCVVLPYLLRAIYWNRRKKKSNIAKRVNIKDSR